jgi:hypothetical protein
MRSAALAWQAQLAASFTCPVCSSWTLPAYIMPDCGHLLCGGCAHSWLARKRSCPVCRSEVPDDPVRCLAVDTFLTAVSKQLATPTASPRLEASQGGRPSPIAMESTPSPPPTKATEATEPSDTAWRRADQDSGGSSSSFQPRGEAPRSTSTRLSMVSHSTGPLALPSSGASPPHHQRHLNPPRLGPGGGRRRLRHAGGVAAVQPEYAAGSPLRRAQLRPSPSPAVLEP